MSDAWGQWFDLLWNQSVEQKIVDQVGDLTICLPKPFFPMLGAISPCSPISGSIKVLTTIDSSVKKTAPFSLSQRTNRGYVNGSHELGFPIEWDPVNATLWVHSLRNNQSVWIAPQSPPSWDWAAPFRSFYTWQSLHLEGMCMVHAAAASFDGKAILITGVGHAGKSTTIGTLLQSGWSILGEDYILLKSEVDALKAASVYKTLKLRLNSPSIQYLPLPNASIYEAASSSERLVLCLNKRAIAKSAQIVAVIEIDPAANMDQPMKISLHEALRPMMYSTIKQVAGGHQQLLSIMRVILNGFPTIPAYRIPRSTPVNNIATIYQDILSKHS